MTNPFRLDPDEVAVRAKEIRKRVIRMNSHAGQGHTGADLSEADILSCMFFRLLRYRPKHPEDTDRDRFVLSKGHGVGGLYATLAEAGILPEGALDTYLAFDSALPGHPVRQKTPFVEVNTGALGHGFSVAVGLALAAHKTGRPSRVYVLLGDGELQEGSNWEAAMSASHFGLGNLLAVVDRNTLQLADRTETIMALEPLCRKLESFGFGVAEVDGNDPAALIRHVETLDWETDRPHALVAHTTKGRGVSFIEDRAAWHHKVPSADEVRAAIEELEMKTEGPRQDLREVMVRRLIAAVDEGVNVVVLVSDSTSTSLIGPFAARFPDRLVNVGIAEQNLLGVAAGMALGGYVAVAAGAAPFIVNRANEQLKNDICYSETNVKVASLNAGVAYGSLAGTHHALDDISIVRGMGNIQIFAPSDPVEADQVVRHALGHGGPVYIRMDNAKFPFLHGQDYRFVPGRTDPLRDGGDLTIFSLGSLTVEAFAAAEALRSRGVSASHVNVPSIRPLDRQAIAREARRTGRVITVEEHSVHGGLGSIVAETVADCGLGVRVRRLGIPEGVFSIVGPRARIREHYGLDAKGIERAALDVLGLPHG